MKIWKFYRGEFSEDSSLPEWVEGQDWYDWLECAGFSGMGFSMGSEIGGDMDIFESKEGGCFLANVSWNSCSCEHIFMPDYPSLLMFLRDFGPIFQITAMRQDIEDMKKLTERTFRKYHKHDVEVVCRDCDPDELDRSQKIRNELMKQSRRLRNAETSS